MVCAPNKANRFEPKCAVICAGPVSLVTTKELSIIKDAICKTDFPIFPKKFKEFIRYMKAYSYCSKIYDVGIIRKYICMTLYIVRYIKNRLF